MSTRAQLNCHFPELPDEDLAVVAEKIGGENSRRIQGLLELLRDKEECLELLDQPAVRDVVVENKNILSDKLYCYVAVRQRLLKAGITSREVAIYLANVWVGYRESGILPDLGDKSGQVMESTEILRELNFINGYEKFELLAMSGNYYLFLMAFFEGYFREMDTLSGRPAIVYYEAFARIAFRAARDHGLSEEFDLWKVYDQLSEHFGEVRKALSGIALTG